MKEGKIFVITGCSGAGKTEIAKMILKIEELRLQKVVTCTSRLPRDGEEDGKDYFFLNEQEFRENIGEIGCLSGLKFMISIMEAEKKMLKKY